MSLSQKHSGLVLVPWYNRAEWEYVYDLAYSNNTQKQLEALNLLKIWKMRTPILPTGIGGTLILLDALLTNNELFSDEQISQLYAVALMRFLNLSAANSDKQGSFMKTSIKNELPKWLVNLRHDIAHGHQIPSKFNLKMGLNFGFNWLEDKYWKPQKIIMKDYMGWSPSTVCDTLASSLQVYIQINIKLFESDQQDDEFIQQIQEKIHKKFKKKDIHPRQMLEILEETIKQSFEADKSQKNVKNFMEILVSRNSLLKPHFEILAEEDTIKLDKHFRDIWKDLLNILHNYDLLFALISKLFDIVINISYSKANKQMAALWINELLISLQNIKQASNLKETEMDYLELQSNASLYTKELLDFQTKVLYYSNQLSLYFLSTLLKYNENDENFILDAVNLIQCTFNSENLPSVQNKIFTLQDLEFPDVVEDVEMIKCDNKNEPHKKSENLIKPIIGSCKWKQIEDTSLFRNCPFGVLPHQINEKHPFLVIS